MTDADGKAYERFLREGPQERLTQAEIIGIYKADRQAALNAKNQYAVSGKGIEGTTVAKGVGNPVKVEGRGNTGRNCPNTLNEQMAMHQVQSNPLEGATKVPIEMTDPRWPASEGWVKMQSVVHNSDGTTIIIHYAYNEITGAFDDFKFK